MTNPVEITPENQLRSPAKAGAQPDSLPAPIRMALAVLNELDPARAEKLRKPLPAYAMTLFRQGKDVTEQILRDALAKGDDRVIGPRPVFNRVAQTIEQRYERITTKMPKKEVPLHLKANLFSSLNDRLSFAAIRGDLSSVQDFIKQGADVRAGDYLVLRWATNYSQHNTAHFLLQKGADISEVDSWDRPRLDLALKNIDHWIKATGDYPPEGFADKKPGSFDTSAVKSIGALICKEGYDQKNSNLYAYNAVAFFGSADKVMDYFEKWAVSGKQLLHDAVQMIPVPEKAPDLTAWRDAVIQQGPEMAKLLKFADKIPQPLKSADGKIWSLAKTREEAAKFAYPKGKENPELATLFNKHHLSEGTFNDALEIVQNFKSKTESRIPEITINGASFGLPKAEFKKLPDGDFRGLVLGQITNCCQSIGGAGEDCAKHGFTSENGGFYIVATNDNEIIGQSWAWRGTKGELVLDSLETLGGRVTKEQWTSLSKEFAKALKGTDVTALHIGTGGATPKLPFKTGSPAAPKDYNGYRDSHSQYKA